jgi:hypothetical protein
MIKSGWCIRIYQTHQKQLKAAIQNLKGKTWQDINVA